jgi:hypothetical protein
MEPIYIVSGLPRSGTSMVMQILEAGGMPIATDRKREPDESNPKGYLEIESIINKLKDNPDIVFNFEGKTLKVIAYGLQFLPQGNYHIIYVERNIEEILDSMEKMMGSKDEEREDTKKAFIKLNDKTKAEIIEREGIKVLFVNYNQILSSPREQINKIFRFLKDRNLDLEKMIGVVDNTLYRQRRLS